MESGWKKYYLVFFNTWETVVEYRLNFFFNILRTSVLPLLMIFFWLSLYKNKTTIGGFDYSSMIIYYLGAMLLYANHSGYANDFVSNQIKQGILTNHLLVPINYFKMVFSSIFADSIFSFLLRFLVVTAVYVFIFPEQIALKMINVAFFIFFIFAGYILNYIINLLIAVSAFWLVENFMLRISILYLIRFFNGYMIPLAFFPPFVLGLIKILPFYYQFYFPLMILMNKVTFKEIITGGIIVAITITGLLLLLKLLWKKGLKHYEAIGR